MRAPNVYQDGWLLLSDNPEIGQRRWVMRNPEDPGQWIVRTETWVPSLVAEANAEEMKENAGKRWKDGRIAARIPLSDLYGPKFLPALKNQDHKHIRKLLNDPDNRWMRTFPGDI